MEKVLGKRSELLNELTLSPYESMLANVFWTIRQQRPTNFGGPEPISYMELDAYIRRMNQPLTPWEVDTIMSMDRTFMGEVMQ